MSATKVRQKDAKNLNFDGLDRLRLRYRYASSCAVGRGYALPAPPMMEKEFKVQYLILWPGKTFSR
jgi:hypothetical protein